MYPNRTNAAASKYEITLSLLQNLKWLNIKKLYVYHVQMVMYKHNYDLLPTICSEFYV